MLEQWRDYVRQWNNHAPLPERLISTHIIATLAKRPYRVNQPNKAFERLLASRGKTIQDLPDSFRPQKTS
ncbi:hypothetical protein WA1_34035 [Scytonema hofmannii PCC 7110]|uniref:Uncharacterized protein n=2 Tax=Scytonema hofmannii TaxID=34078 RepID=A0A139X318_9CYAN|nr:hypothetical protein WA1_34035 [Scytonema hofmannii PCC 7110]